LGEHPVTRTLNFLSRSRRLLRSASSYRGDVLAEVSGKCASEVSGEPFLDVALEVMPAEVRREEFREEGSAARAGAQVVLADGLLLFVHDVLGVSRRSEHA
jgi:hypothetical protein